MSTKTVKHGYLLFTNDYGKPDFIPVIVEKESVQFGKNVVFLRNGNKWIDEEKIVFVKPNLA